MLTYKAHTNLHDCTEGKCNRIVIYNDNGDPVAFVIQIGANQYLTSNIGNDDFNNLLSTFNIDKLNMKCDEK